MPVTQDPIFYGSPDELQYTVFDRDPAPVAEAGLPNYWVNTSSLALIIQDTIFRYQGIGPIIAGTLIYHSGSSISGLFGVKWRFSYESDIRINGSTISVTRGSGQIVRYTRSQLPAQPGQPVEMVPLDNQFDRLLDYGTHWLYIEKKTFLMYRYDKAAGSPRSLLSAISDANGNTVRLRYSPAGILESVTDAAGRTLQVQTDPAGRCLQISLPDGRKAAFHYDSQGRLARSTDFEGIPSEYTYDSNHCIISMIVAKDRKTTLFSYGGAGIRVTSVTDAAGHVRRYELISDTPRRIKVTDPENNETIYQSNGGVTESIENGNQAVRFTYNAKRQRISATSRLGHITRFDYDHRGNVTRITNPLGLHVSYTWTGYDLISTITDALGNTTSISYDERQNPVTFITPSGLRQSYTYDQQGRIVTYTSPAGRKHTFTYDRFGNPVSQTNPSGGSLTFDYDPTGLHLTGFTDANTNRTSFVADNNGRLTRILRPDGSVKEHTYGCCAGLSTRDENGIVSRFVRDPRLLVTEYINGAGQTLRFTHDRLHRLTSITDPLGSLTGLAFNDRDSTIRVNSPIGTTVIYAFDSEGNLTSVSDSEGALFQYTYDPCGLLAGYSDAAGGSEEYRRDAAGRITTTRSGSRDTRNYTYDTDGRITEKMHNRAVFAVYGYDNDGNLIRMDDRTGRTEYARNGSGQVSAITYPGGKSLSVAYNPAGYVTTIRYPDGTEVVYAYDNRERIVSVQWGLDHVRFRYDKTGKVTGITRSNGVESTFQYSADNSLAGIRHARGTDLLAHLVYTRDANGNVTEERAFLPMQPDHAPQPFHARCNRVGQVVSWGAQSFTYNAGGCLTGNGTGQWEGVYDPENRLVRVKNGSRVQEFIYNGLGQRTGIVSETGTRTLHYDLWGRLLFETDREGTIVSCFIYAGNLLIARHRPGSGTGFYHFDKTGSTVCITGPAGNVEAAYVYDTHGLVTGRSSYGDQNPFTFVGMHGVMDDGDGMYLMKHRHYDAVTGRFLQRDPIGIRGGLNLYTYAANNPVSVIDPEGTWILAGVLALLTTFTVCAGIGIYAVNTFTPENSIFKRAIDFANTRTLEHMPSNEPHVETATVDLINASMGPDPGTEAQTEVAQVVVKTFDKAISAHRIAGPGYKGVKTLALLAAGEPVAAVKTGAALVPYYANMPDAASATGLVKAASDTYDECNPAP